MNLNLLSSIYLKKRPPHCEGGDNKRISNKQTNDTKKVGVFSEGNIRNPVYGSLVTLFSQPLNIV